MNTQMMSGRRRQSLIRHDNVDDHQHNNTAISDDNEDDQKAAASAVADPSNTYNNSAPGQPYIHHADDDYDHQLMIMNTDYNYNNMRHAVEVELEAGGVQIVNRALFLRSYQFSRKQTLPQKMKASLQRIKSMASTLAAYNNNSHPHHIVPPKLKPPKLMLIKNMITSHVHHS